MRRNPYPNEHSARLQDPDKYVRFARSNNRMDVGVDVIFGFLPNGSSNIQAIRFRTNTWSRQGAIDWLKSHHFWKHVILFEPATNTKENPMRKSLVEKVFEKIGSNKYWDLREEMEKFYASRESSNNAYVVAFEHKMMDKYKLSKKEYKAVANQMQDDLYPEDEENPKKKYRRNHHISFDKSHYAFWNKLSGKKQGYLMALIIEQRDLGVSLATMPRMLEHKYDIDLDFARWLIKYYRNIGGR